jgi:predicted alpha/beta-hydrolase family hydrolase
VTADPDPLVIEPPAPHAALVVGHGAGSPAASPFLAGFCQAIAGEGVATLRFDFPYMAAGRRAPDRAPLLIESYRLAFQRAQQRWPALPLFAGGRSMGGRIASMAAAEGMPAAGLVFLAYPLHPPGRPEKLRDEHLYGLSQPMLFLQGTRDAFAQPALLSAVLERLGARAQLVPLEGADHGFRRAGGPHDAAALGAELAPPAARFIARVAPAAG